MDLHERVARISSRYSMFAPGQRVGVGVSGGADSVALLYVLRELSERLQIVPVVLHVNHQLRGAESEEDEQFVRDLARSLGVPGLFERAAINEGNLEEEARQVRRAFFARVRDTNAVQTVALGHTLSDQAETVLFRLVRGSGTAGLAGMRPVSLGYLVRPFLTTGRAEVRDWAIARGIAWREDSSNQDLRYSRNWLRQTILPKLQERLNPQLERVLAGEAEISQAEEDYWTGLIEPIYQMGIERGPYGLIFDVDRLGAQPKAVQRRLVRRMVSELRGDLRAIGFEHIEAILAITQTTRGHDRVIVPGVDALRSFRKLRMSKPGKQGEERRHYVRALEPGKLCELPYGAGVISLERVGLSPRICVRFKGEAASLDEGSVELAKIDEDALPESLRARPLCLRNWEPGDAIERVGRQSAEKIKALFQEFRVLLWERKHWPVLVSGQEIVWVRKFGPASRFAASAQSRSVLRLSYRAG